MIMDVTMWCLIFMVVVATAVPSGRCACIKQASKNLVNECANPALNNCDEDATCTDLPDGFSCSCNAGFTGDGTTCTELCNGEVCDAGENRTCYRDESCVCIPGFHVLGDACVEACDVYGGTFNVYNGSQLDCDPVSIPASDATFIECENLCKLIPECLSFVYLFDVSMCIIFECDPLTADAVFSFVGGSTATFVRNCEE